MYRIRKCIDLDNFFFDMSIGRGGGRGGFGGGGFNQGPPSEVVGKNLITYHYTYIYIY